MPNSVSKLTMAYNNRIMFLVHVLLVVAFHPSIDPKHNPVRGVDSGMMATPGTAGYACEAGLNTILQPSRCNFLGTTHIGEPCCEWYLPDGYVKGDPVKQQLGAGRCYAKEEARNEKCFCENWKAEYFGCIPVALKPEEQKAPQEQELETSQPRHPKVLAIMLLLTGTGMTLTTAAFCRLAGKKTGPALQPLL
eukprot:gnl/MRDRNA2_/MRDRNA2_75192_c0_seq1.p1 gnl/MRDRNA2_/MRDRNA2_75192_c0~~gnl/MRDRNA2_/MRDRNA2_75192_c0_seq1.p1  ORF type:complete len:206 (+),score=32.72 gnl/MRDRNA2_/MRDRNA2_75192_c0_seq1:42-620(+)